MHTHRVLFALWMLVAVMGVAVLGFLGYHVVYICSRNETTNERTKRSSIRNFQWDAFVEQQKADNAARDKERGGDRRQNDKSVGQKHAAPGDSDDLLSPEELVALEEEFRYMKALTHKNIYSKGLLGNWKEALGFSSEVKALEEAKAAENRANRKASLNEVQTRRKSKAKHRGR